MFLEAIEESLDCSDNDEEALFAICLLYAAIGNKGELSFFLYLSRICFLRMACQGNNNKKISPPPSSVNTPVSRLGERRNKESFQRENRYKGTNNSEFYYAYSCFVAKFVQSCSRLVLTSSSFPQV